MDEIIGVPGGYGRKNNKRDPGKLKACDPHSGERALGLNLGDERGSMALALASSSLLKGDDHHSFPENHM